ncbi:selenocysteine-specific translation elongation factor [Caenimonas koreensis]|uniref:selenocysteine-specific translation elongation factor n=1 Tax=Caenimonas koreensis TaxID=367474 RepID=UPI00378530FB
MIVGTAGHIDHGKTALVRALTGIDADRLPEEKRRGITIELGYASMPVAGSESISFVDVPGHEKLVRTMVAGASGIDYALLLVAADDGVMPQTREHLTILSLLGVRRGAAVVTKIDRVDEAVAAQREAEVRALLAKEGLVDWPVLRVAALRGDGVEQLRELLVAESANATRPADTHAAFRMPLDRVFTLSGVGTVVAGSIAAGSVRIGAELCLAHAPQRLLRVRGLQVHGAAVEEASAGQRCAVGLASLAREEVERGQVLCDPAIAQQSDRIDVWLRVAASEEAPLRSGALVHLHIGTQEVMASVAVLGQPALAPGEEGAAQLVLRQAICAWQHDRFVLRNASAARTVGGGLVLDAHPPVRYRQTPQRLALLATQRAPDAMARLAGALEHSPLGVNAAQWLRDAGLASWPVELASLNDAVVTKDGEWIIGRQAMLVAQHALLAALADFHERSPQEVGLELRRARRQAAPRMEDALWLSLVDNLRESGQVGLRGSFLHLPAHGEQLRAADRVVAERAMPLLIEGRFDPPWVRDVAASINLPEEQVRQVLGRLAKTGEIFAIVKDLYYPPRTVLELAQIARTLGKNDASITAAAFRDATGLGRKRAIQILEFFDRVGMTRRVGDDHLLRPGTQLFAQEESV